MSDITAQIESRIRTFVQELHGLVRASAVDAVRGALGGDAPASSKRGPGRPRKVTAAVSAPAAPLRAAHPAQGGKRDPALLAKTVEALRRHVVAHPGQRIEKIAPALGVKTKDLALPVHKLLNAKSITKKGQKRSTTYWPVVKK